MVEHLLGTDRAAAIREVLLLPNIDLHAPSLCDVEVAAALRRALSRRALSETRATQAVEDYLDLRLTRHSHQTLLPRILELRSNFTAYDACYVALAEHLEAEILTADGPLSRAVREHTRTGVLSSGSH